MASIARRTDGRWRARYRDEAGKEHARHFDRKVDAQRWLNEVNAAVVTGQYVDPRAGRVTLAEYYAAWSERQVWVPGTAQAMALAVRSTTFADVELRVLRRSHVESWVKAMSATLAPGTVRTRVNNVRSVFRAAVRDRLIPADPTEGVALPRARRADAAMVLPTPEDVAAVLAAADPGFRAFVALAAFAGLRLGEAAALQVHDVDFLRRTVTVVRQVQRANGGSVEIRAPKYGSERTVYVADALLQLLAEHVSALPAGAEPRWLFRGEQDMPPHQNTVGYWWRRTRTASGIEGVRLHDLRHFYASGLIAAGCDVVTVQRALGHAKATTTLSTYAHLWPSAEDRTRRAAAGLMTTVLSLAAAADCLRTGEAP